MTTFFSQGSGWIVKGMTGTEVLDVMAAPERVTRVEMQGYVDVWAYPNYMMTIAFKNGAVTDWKFSKAAKSGAAAGLLK